MIPRETEYGRTIIVKMTAWDEERECFANDMVWFCTGENVMEKDKEYEIAGTVKGHNIYNDRAETMVNRVRVKKTS